MIEDPHAQGWEDGLDGKSVRIIVGATSAEQNLYADGYRKGAARRVECAPLAEGTGRRVEFAAAAPGALTPTKAQIDALREVMEEALEIGARGTQGDYTASGLAYEAFRKMGAAG